ncbi:hypothetical protein T06_10761 [Trichinella sp. T6]|nr:hypothetical protein T06_10761 [Trichinella sp. T6]
MPTELRMIIVKLTHDNIRESANQCNEDKNIKTSLFRLQKQYSAQTQSPLERHLLLMDNNNKMRNSYRVVVMFSRCRTSVLFFTYRHLCLKRMVPTCSRENVCKFLFHCYTYAYGALVQGVWCTVQVQRSFPCDEDHGITLNTRMEDGSER